MPSTTAKGVPYAVGGDAAASIDTIMQTLAEWVDAAPGIAALTTVQRDALAGAARWNGRVIYNTTLARLQSWNGTAWTSDVAAVSTAALTDLAVTTAKLADGAATLAKIASSSYASAPTPTTLAIRDAAGRTQVATPSADSDAANKSYVDALGLSAATPGSVVRRDAAGRSQIVAPSVAADIANKGYVDAADAALLSTLVSGWTYLGYNSGWGASPYSGFDQIAYAKIGSTVFVYGAAHWFSAGTGVVGTLPVGFRPPVNHTYHALRTDNVNNNLGRFGVSTNGALSVNNVQVGETFTFSIFFRNA